MLGNYILTPTPEVSAWPIFAILRSGDPKESLNLSRKESFKLVAPESILKSHTRGFPGGAVVESPPADAGDTGLCPGPGRSHMPRSGWAREPWPLSLCVRSLCSATGEATTVRGPRTANNNNNNNAKRPSQHNRSDRTPAKEDSKRTSLGLHPGCNIQKSS